MPDLILLRGLRAVGVHGVNPEEKARAQPWEVDLELELDLAQAGATDNLADTVDYGGVCVAVERIIIGERHELLERLAQRIAECVLREPLIDAVTVEIRKLRPPVPVDVSTSGVRITRRRVRSDPARSGPNTSDN